MANAAAAVCDPGPRRRPHRQSACAGSALSPI